MLPKYHILIGLLASLMIYSLYELTVIQASIIFLSSFLIDVDHYLIYTWVKRDISLKNARNYFHKRRDKWMNLNTPEQKKYKRYIYAFHGIEFWLLLFWASTYLPILLFIIYGFIIHMILDYIDFIYYKQPIYAKFSQLYVYITNKKKIDLDKEIIRGI